MDKKQLETNNIHKKLPFIITIAMVVIILIQTIAIVFMLVHTDIKEADVSVFWAACEEMFMGNFITLGISIIGIAVSVWVGLNINVAIDKEELSKKIAEVNKETEGLKRSNEETLVAFKENQEKIANSYERSYKESLSHLKKEYVGFLKLQWLDMISNSSEENVLSKYLATRLKSVDINENVELISFLIHYEKAYISVVNLYESEKRVACIEKAKKLLNEEVETASKELQLYYDVRKSDIIFYKCACEIREGKSESILITELEQSLNIYKILADDGRIAIFSDDTDVYAYIYNTIGYTYDLMNQLEEEPDRIERAICYMEKAVAALKGEKNKKKGRYYKNLGLTYHRAKMWDKAREAYEKSITNDPSDYKCYVVITGNIIERIERELDIKNRTKLLCEMEDKCFLKYKSDLEYAVGLCEECININYMFEDAYYKIAQAYTYLYLGTGKQKMDILEAEKYLNKLQRRGFNRAGYKFALRNMYEARGDIQNANDVNNTIIRNAKNDVEQISELYKEYIEGGKEIEQVHMAVKTMGEELIAAPKDILVDDYCMLYSGLEVASELLKNPILTYEKWSLLHGIIKGYLIDRANKESHTMYTDKIYGWFEELLEEVNKRKPDLN